MRDVYEQLREQPRIRITVLTYEGQPTFEVPSSYLAGVVNRMVLDRYGQQANGNPHNWRGDRYVAEGK